MASEYAYTSLTNLENFTGYNYDGINSTQFSDARVEATITLAERIVNGYLGVSTAQTVTDGIIVATTAIAAKLMYKKMVDFGYAVEGQEDNDLMQMSISNILRTFVKEHDADTVDHIPMNGANNNGCFSLDGG